MLIFGCRMEGKNPFFSLYVVGILNKAGLLLRSFFAMESRAAFFFSSLLKTTLETEDVL